MSFFDIFAPQQQKPQQQQQQQPEPQQQQQQQLTSQQPQQQQNAPGTAPSGNPQITPPEPKSPLDQFSDLFTMDENQPQEEDPNSDYLTYDEEKLKPTIEGLDFTTGEGFQQLAQQALGGDVKAFSQVINTAVRAAVGKSMQYSSAMANHAAKGAYSRSMEQLPKSVKSLMSDNETTSEQFKHPAVQPIVKGLKAQFARKYPDATASELTKMTKDFMQTLSVSFTGEEGGDPTQREQKANEPRKGQDFSSFFMN